MRRLAAARGTSLNALCAQLLDDATRPKVEAGVVPAPEQGAGWRSLIERIAEAYHEDLIGVVLFGSAARHELRAESDIDLLVVLADGVPLRRRLYARWDELSAASDLEHEVNAHFVHLPTSVDGAGSLWLEVAIEGRVMHDREGRVERFLLAVRRAIAAGRFVRETAHGQPYWRRAA